MIAALLLLSAIAVLPAVAYYQESNSGLLFIENSFDRSLFGWSIPTPTFNSLDGFFCMALVPPLIAWWRAQSKRGTEPGDMGKIAIGYLVIAIASLVIMIPAYWVDQGGTGMSPLWAVAMFSLNALGFLYYWPTLLALFSRAAPAQVNATMMGMLYFSLFAGNVLVGVFGGWWELMSHTRFWAFHAALALGPFVVMLLIARPFGRLLAAKETAAV